MHHNFLFDLDQTLLDFHASERKALGMVLRGNGLSFSEEIYQAFKACNKSLWLELEKGALTRTELFTKRFLYVFSLSISPPTAPPLTQRAESLPRAWTGISTTCLSARTWA